MHPIHIGGKYFDIQMISVLSWTNARFWFFSTIFPHFLERRCQREGRLHHHNQPSVGPKAPPSSSNLRSPFFISSLLWERHGCDKQKCERNRNRIRYKHIRHHNVIANFAIIVVSGSIGHSVIVTFPFYYQGHWNWHFSILILTRT